MEFAFAVCNISRSPPKLDNGDLELANSMAEGWTHVEQWPLYVCAIASSRH